MGVVVEVVVLLVCFFFTPGTFPCGRVSTSCSDTATEVFLASSRNNDPACVGDPVIYTCSIINGRRLSWNFGEVCLFHYNPSREDYECGVYSMLNPGILRSTALPPDAEVSSVIAQNETSTVFNCTSILKITVTSPTTGNFTCIAVGEDGDVSKSHFYNVLGEPSSPTLNKRKIVDSSNSTLYDISWNTSDNATDLEYYVLVVDGYDNCTPQNIVVHPNSSNYLLEIESGQSCNVSLQVVDKCDKRNYSQTSVTVIGSDAMKMETLTVAVILVTALLSLV